MEKKGTYTIQELAEFYEVNKKTIYNWLLPIRKDLLAMNPLHQKRLRILKPKQLKLIKEFLG
jgi:transposase